VKISGFIGFLFSKNQSDVSDLSDLSDRFASEFFLRPLR